MSDDSADWPDLAGKLVGQDHVLPVRVYFEDTDFSGLVYHANYLKWIERGRSDFLRLLGVHQGELFDGGENGEEAVFVVRRMELEYIRPARIDDVVEVHTTCAELGAAWIWLTQSVQRGDTTLFTARVQVVLISSSGKPLRLSDHIREAFDG